MCTGLNVRGLFMHRLRFTPAAIYIGADLHWTNLRWANLPGPDVPRADRGSRRVRPAHVEAVDHG